MIDAIAFSSSYNAFWHANAPTCEHFVRRLNLSELERFARPIDGVDSPSRAVIAELAFSIFVEQLLNKRNGLLHRTNNEIRSQAWKVTKSRLSVYAAQGLDIDRELLV